ncbi:hypothetical protein GALMADRAFT_259053 [Galerina marginata CBS 339.88]|uniref:Uncharacterized protein n=1 Tax=Galerina marginata (strain CBS 339.88) TaxID=685588 RepID=A0A067SIG0_GALM3|nr:hypothetical protein GALMADRAFT_259053 [Galerina marginata CBS 339.88]
MTLSYGLPIEDSNDPYLKIAEQALASLGEAALPGAFLVNVIPILKYVPEFFPGAGFKTKARMWRKLQEDFLTIPYEEIVKRCWRSQTVFHIDILTVSGGG